MSKSAIQSFNEISVVLKTAAFDVLSAAIADFDHRHDITDVKTQATDGIIVCDTIDGWEESLGVTAEIKYATECGKPILYYSNLKHLSDEALVGVLY